jgi:hypothetical protein
VDRAISAAATAQLRVGRIHNRANLLAGDVALHNAQARRQKRPSVCVHGDFTRGGPPVCLE